VNLPGTTAVAPSAAAPLQRSRGAPGRPAPDELVGTADVERPLVSAKLQPGARGADIRCGTAKVRVVEVGGAIACTIKGTVVVRG
jgi:hypothetical protein